MVLANILFSLPGGFFLGMVAPLNFAKLDSLAASNSAGKLKNLDGLPHRSDHSPTELLPGALYLLVEYWPSLHGTSLTGKRETHHELLTVLPVTPTCRLLLPYVPKLGMVLQIVGLTFL